MGILDFAKKQKEKKRVGDAWVIAEGYEDLPILYRLRKCVPEGILIKDYPFLLSILWEYETDNPSGMPSNEINKLQSSFENALDQMNSSGSGIMMLVVTGNGRREWVWYVNDPQVWLQILHECLQGHPAYPLDIQQSEDPEWETWKTFRDSFK